MRIESFPDRATPPSLRTQALALQDREWPAEGGEQTQGHDPSLDPVAVLLLDDSGMVVATLDILSKELVHRGERYRVSGLSAVVTDPARRGLGHGHRLVMTAHELIRASGADLSIFTCDSSLAPFYERAGWHVLPGTVLVGGTPEEPFPSDQFDKVTLGAFFTEHAHRHSSDFYGARVELFPGLVDKLW